MSKLAYKTTKYKYQSKFPSVQRDISIIVDKNIKNNDIENSISRAAGKYLNEIRLFDLYEGKTSLQIKINGIFFDLYSC